MKDNNELTLEVELIKKDVHDIKHNHLTHIEADLRDVKREVFKFKYIVWTVIAIFVLTTDKFTDILNCLLYTSPSPRDSDSSRMPSSA